MKRVKDLMKRENLIHVHEDTPVTRVNRIMIENGVSSVPVVDGSDELCGIVSEKHVLRLLDSSDYHNLKARDVMQTDVIAVDVDDPVEKVIRIFTDHPFRRMPVVREKTVVGVVTRTDALSACLETFY